MATKVNADNFNRAETDRYMAQFVSEGAGGAFLHNRLPVDIDHQTVIRMNRDTLYSVAVIDLEAGPATITLPDGGDRYVALQVIDQDHYVAQIAYDVGDDTFAREYFPTRYLAAFVRIEVNADDPQDIAKVNELQDQIILSQAEKGEFSFGDWDKETLDETRSLLLGLGRGMTGFQNAFGAKEDVSPVHHLIATAAGWGGNPDDAAVYVPFHVDQNDGKTAYKLTVPADVPCDAFWSISVYNAGGFFEKNDLGLYSLNNLTAKRDADGSVHVHFGGSPDVDNYLPIVEGWNYLVRLYRPRPEVLDGIWTFPAPELA